MVGSIFHIFLMAKVCVAMELQMNFFMLLLSNQKVLSPSLSSKDVFKETIGSKIHHLLSSYALGNKCSTYRDIGTTKSIYITKVENMPNHILPHIAWNVDVKYKRQEHNSLIRLGS